MRAFFLWRINFAAFFAGCAFTVSAGKFGGTLHAVLLKPRGEARRLFFAERGSDLRAILAQWRAWLLAVECCARLLVGCRKQRLGKRGAQVLTIKPGFIDMPMTLALAKSLLWRTPQRIVCGIVEAVERKRDGVCLPRLRGGGGERSRSSSLLFPSVFSKGCCEART